MGFQEAEAYLNSLGIDAMKKMAPSLHRMEAFCETLNNPERAIPAIHITGTNGKTSTARIVSEPMSMPTIFLWLLGNVAEFKKNYAFTKIQLWRHLATSK